MRTCLIMLPALLAGLAAGGQLFGNDFLTSGAGARATATGGGYLPSNESPLDAMAINPAGLALLGGPAAEVGLAMGGARGSFTKAGNPDGKLSAFGALPFGAFGSPLGKSRWSIGFSATPELMSDASWSYVDPPGGAGNIGYGLLDHRSRIVAVRTAAGVAVSLGSRVQLGGTFGAVLNANRLRTAYIFQSHPALAGLKTLLDLETSGTGYNGSAGVLVRVHRRLQIGAAYKSRTVIASEGTATGNLGVQFQAAGLGGARPDFRYDARVDSTLPQSVTANIVWRVMNRTRLVTQGDWVNWRRAFANLPVTLTNGDNADINGLLGSNSIRDVVPVHWKDQGVVRVGVERSWLERAVVRAGFAHQTNPVPGSTLTPLTAAIMRNRLTAGFGYSFFRSRLDLAYTFTPLSSASVGRSLLKSGEYSDSKVSAGTQGLLISLTIR